MPTGPTEITDLVVGDAGGGLLVLAGSAKAAATATEGSPTANLDPAELLSEVDGAARATVTPTPPRDCVTAVTTGQDLEPAAGELVVDTGGDARADRLQLDRLADTGFELGEVTAEGSSVRVEVSYDPTQSLRGPVGLLGGDLHQHVVYRCPGGG